MVVIEQALEVVIALILFIGLVWLFFSIFGSAECDKFSNTTAIELSNTISKVALESGVSPWTGSGIPADAKTDYYATVPIRLCEKNGFGAIGALFSSQMPTYILTYETMPEAGNAWSESQPFSGGAMQSVFNYMEMKYFTKAVTFFGSLGVRVAKWVGGKVVNSVWKGGWELLKLKIMRYLQNNDDNRIARALLNRFFSADTEKTVEEDVADQQLNRLNYLGKANKDTFNEFLSAKEKDGLSKEAALVKIGAIEGGYEMEGGEIKYLPRLNGEGKYVVTPQYRQFMSMYIENSGDAADALAQKYYFPSRWGWLEDIKTQKWYPLKYRVQEMISNFKGKFQPLKDFFGNVKDKFNKYFNYNNYVPSSRVPQELGIQKEFLLSIHDEVEGEMKTNFDELKDPLNKIYKDLGVNRIVETADDINTEDAIVWINNFEKTHQTSLIAKYIPRYQQDLTDVTSRYFGDKTEALVNKIKDAEGDPVAQLQAYRELQKFWSGPTETVGGELTTELTRDFVQEDGTPFDMTLAWGQIDAARGNAKGAVMGSGILYDMNACGGPCVAGALRADWLAEKVDDIQAQMKIAKYQLPKYVVQKSTPFQDLFFQNPTITEDSLKDITAEIGRAHV
jgi:hypothetical protein